MGASSAEGEYKRQRGVLSRLKKIAIAIAILDLILAINDSRRVGTFFLLLTMSSTFDTSPENVIREHCLENVEGICETYFITISGGAVIRTFDGKPSHYYGTTKAFHRYIFPETFKELVHSWLAMFDQSRADTNVSFYYDGVPEQPLSSSSPDVPNLQETYLVDNNRRHFNQSQNSSTLHHIQSQDSSVAPRPNLTSSTNSPRPATRKKRGVPWTNGENNSADMGEKPEKNANPNISTVTSSSASPQIPKDLKEITPTTKESKTTVHIQEESAAWRKAGEKVKQKGKPMIVNSPPVMDKGRKDLLRGNDHDCRRTRSTKLLPEFDNGIMSKGPKKLITFVQDEVMARWPCLLQEVGDVLEQKNITSSASPEAGRIKMFIEVRPFGPDSFKDSRKRLQATQQILFDYPWLTMFQIHSRLSGAFTKMFIVISLYTWIWGTVIALMLLIGSLTEDQTTLHGWIIFNILYSLLLFMIDDWIHSNICPQRSSISVWLFVIYSLYKPIAAWIGFTQWSEMKKMVSLEAHTSTSTSNSNSSTTSNLKSLNSRKGTSGNNSSVKGKRRLRSPSPSSTTTKESTVVDIITPTPTPTLPTKTTNIKSSSILVSTLEQGEAQHDDAGGGLLASNGNCDDDVDIEEFEDLDEDLDDIDEDDDDSESEEEDVETKDLEKVGSGGNDDEE